MNENITQTQDFTRRDFLKGGSVATLMTMLGGVELLAQTNAPPAGEIHWTGPKIKVGVIGLGAWGREMVNTVSVSEPGEVAAICDSYPSALKRCAKDAPNATQTDDYKTILANKDIKAVVVATPTHKHKEIVLEALNAGKHVYCEAPLANTIEDARAIASAAKAAKTSIFQAGLQVRSDKERPFLLPFIRSGSLGQWSMARAQWHRKQSWRTVSPNPEREKELNWRLDKSVSLGLVGEVSIHQVDQAAWFINALPVSVTGFGAIRLYTDDGRDVPDTVHAVFEFPGKIHMVCDATLTNHFESDYEVWYGSNAAVMLRDGKAWIFKETDSPNFDWEVYAKKDQFYDETGIALVAGASKSVQTKQAAPPPFTATPLAHAVDAFLRNVSAFMIKEKDAIDAFGADDKEAIAGELANVKKIPAPGFLEGYHATVMAIKANEAVHTGQRTEIKKDLYELS
jgi:predicted dehydrogenase